MTRPATSQPAPIRRCHLRRAPALALLVLAQSAAAQTRPQQTERFRDVRAAINQMVEGGVPSVIVAVAKDGEIIWEEGFGWANRERRVAATPHTPYSIASINKAITATAVMVLSERGKIDLDAPIERYLGGIRLTGHAADARGVTARRIMAHSAGLPTHYRMLFTTEKLPPPEETLGRYGVVVFPPGEHFEYSNIGYRALDVAISNASGMPYGEFLRREIFAPLGMTRSALDIDPAWAAEAAPRYDDGSQTPLAHYRSDHPGSGDVFASAHDMLRFGMFHIGTLRTARPLLRPASLRTMHSDASPTEVQWGLGWQLNRDRGHHVVEHGGGQPGVSTHLALYPDEKLAIVVFANRAAAVQGVARRIAAVVLPKERANAADTATAVTPSPLAGLEGRWVGTVTTYEGKEPISLTIPPQGDIHASLGTLLVTSLVSNVGRSGNALTGSFYGVVNTGDARPHRHNVSFALIPKGGELAGQITARGIDAIFGLSSYVRLKRLNEALLQEYAGAYRHGEGDLRTITREGDRLYSQRGTGHRYELQPLGEDLFLMVGTGGSTLRFVRENGRVVEVDWSGRARARRVEGKG
jgi:CubicO group peptidase (beta-lactamase class C family)